jgi:hypothetical protein
MLSKMITNVIQLNGMRHLRRQQGYHMIPFVKCPALLFDPVPANHPGIKLRTTSWWCTQAHCWIVFLLFFHPCRVAGSETVSIFFLSAYGMTVRQKTNVNRRPN